MRSCTVNLTECGSPGNCTMYQDLPATFWQFCECREACLSYQGAIVELLSGEVRIVPAEHVTFI
jgi:hypothetical protein